MEERKSHQRKLVFQDPMVQSLLHRHLHLPKNRDCQGNTLYHMLVKNDCFDAITHMLHMGKFNLHATNKNLETPLHVACQGGINLLGHARQLIDARADIRARTFEKNTALHFACSMDLTCLARYLIEETKMDIHAQNIRGETPLHCAVKRNCLFMVRFLVQDAKVNPRLTNTRKQSPLELACLLGYCRMVKLFIDDLQVPCSTRLMERLFLQSAKNNYESLVQYFLEEKKVDKNTQDPRTGACALGFAIENENFTLVQYLVNQTQVDVDIRDRLGRTCLFFVRQTYIEIFEFLITEGKANINVKDNTGETIFMRAVRQKHNAFVSFLLKQPSLQLQDGESSIVQSSS